MGCVEDLKCQILIRDASFRECREYVRSHFSESIDVEPGFKSLMSMSSVFPR